MIDFAVRAPDESTFWQSFADAGIGEYDADGQWHYLPPYAGCVQVSDWGSGQIVDTPAVLEEIIITPAVVDPDTDEVLVPAETEIVEVSPAVMKSGWFCNVRVSGAVEQSMIQGLPQTDQDGNLLSVFQRTHAVAVFGLTQQPYDANTNFPAGYRNSLGVHYADVANIATPHNVWA